MEEKEQPYKIVVIGGSAGSLDVVLGSIGQWPARAGVTYLLVVHRRNDCESLLATLLAARTAMDVREVEDKDPLLPNTVYLAPPGYHLLLEDQQHFSLDSSEKVHYSRPSIDVTFESVANTFGPQSVGVLLSGANADGAEGMWHLKRSGAYTLVQDPATAEVDYMPLQAIRKQAFHQVVPAAALGATIQSLLLQ